MPKIQLSEFRKRDLVIRELPATTNSQTLIASIKKAAEKNKIRISNIGDFTSDHVEIRITPTRGYDPEKTRQGLYMYTDCSVSISPKMVVICDRRPKQMTVTEVLKRNVSRLLEYLRRDCSGFADCLFGRQKQPLHQPSVGKHAAGHRGTVD